MEYLAAIFTCVLLPILLDPFLGKELDNNINAVDDGINNPKDDTQVVSGRLHGGGPVGDGMVVHIDAVVIVDIVRLDHGWLDFDGLYLPLRASINYCSILCGIN